MGVKERRARERTQQRQRILDAALEIISQEGFAALSMRKLGERIEYSAASIYLYFNNRDQLARELRRVGFEQLLAKMAAAIKSRSGRKALHAIGSAYVIFGKEQPELYRLMFMGEPDAMREVYADMESDTTADRAYQLLVEVTQTLEGVPKQRATPVEIADVIWSCLHGMVSLHLALPGLQDTPTEIQQKLSLAQLASGLQQAQVR